MNRRRALSNAESVLVETFIAAAQSAALDWLGADLLVVDQYIERAEEWNRKRLIASLPLLPTSAEGASTAPLHLVLAIDEAAAAQLAQRAFAEIDVRLDRDLLRDCVAEFANLVAGRAKALTLGSWAHFLLGTPTMQPPKIDKEYGTVVFDGDLGGLSLHLEFRDLQ